MKHLFSQVWVATKRWAETIRQDCTAMMTALGDPAVGWAPRIILFFALAYAISPIDLIPDFIPVLGILDEIILIPASLALAARFMPDGLLEKHRSAARQPADNTRRRLERAGMVIVCSLWAIGLATALYLIFVD